MFIPEPKTMNGPAQDEIAIAALFCFWRVKLERFLPIIRRFVNELAARETRCAESRPIGL